MIKLTSVILILANVLVFIIFQVIFFYFIGSDQLNTLIGEKVDIVNEYLKYNPDYKSKLKDYIDSNEIQSMISKAQDEKKERSKKNINHILLWIGIPVGILLILMFLCVILLKIFKVEWTAIDNVGLTLIVTAYVTELAIYFGVIKKYEFLGDQTLYYYIYDLFKKEIIHDTSLFFINGSMNGSGNININYENMKQLIENTLENTKSSSGNSTENGSKNFDVKEILDTISSFIIPYMR
jgi:amino acid transporter